MRVSLSTEQHISPCIIFETINALYIEITTNSTSYNVRFDTRHNVYTSENYDVEFKLDYKHVSHKLNVLCGKYAWYVTFPYRGQMVHRYDNQFIAILTTFNDQQMYLTCESRCSITY